MVFDAKVLESKDFIGWLLLCLSVYVRLGDSNPSPLSCSTSLQCLAD